MTGIRDSGFGPSTGSGPPRATSRGGIRLARCLAGGLLLALTLPLPALAAEPQTVTFAARDGVQVSGVLYVPDRTPAPAVVLLHMLGRTHRDWDGPAAALTEAGFAVLAVDFRRLPAAGAESGSQAGTPFAAFVLDAEAARAYLAARPEVNPGRIGMAGASVGANVAVLAAANDASVRSLALLSVSLDYRGLKLEQALTRFGSRPALLVASADDPYAVRSAREAVPMGNGARVLMVLSGAGHGSMMLEHDPDLATSLVDWFLRTLL